MKPRARWGSFVRRRAVSGVALPAYMRSTVTSKMRQRVRAQIEDCIYVFKTAGEVVLSRDPIQLLKVTGVKGIVGEAAR
jgi:hypothetical protein